MSGVGCRLDVIRLGLRRFLGLRITHSHEYIFSGRERSTGQEISKTRQENTINTVEVE